MRIVVRDHDYSGDLCVYLLEDVSPPKQEIAANGTIVRTLPGTVRVLHPGRLEWEERSYQLGDQTEPSFVMQREYAQRLMDGLWDCGLRPTVLRNAVSMAGNETSRQMEAVLGKVMFLAAGGRE